MINPITAYNSKGQNKSKVKKAVIASGIAGAAIGSAQTANDIFHTLKKQNMTLKELVSLCDGKLKFLSASTLVPNALKGTAIGVAGMAAIAMAANAVKPKTKN